MWKKAISYFLLGLALVGCGNNNNEAFEDSRLTPKVKEEMMEESNPGVPGVRDLDEDSGINSEDRIDEGVYPEHNATIESPEMDGNSTKNGLDENR